MLSQGHGTGKFVFFGRFRAAFCRPSSRKLPSFWELSPSLDVDSGDSRNAALLFDLTHPSALRPQDPCALDTIRLLDEAASSFPAHDMEKFIYGASRSSGPPTNLEHLITGLGPTKTSYWTTRKLLRIQSLI